MRNGKQLATTFFLALMAFAAAPSAHAMLGFPKPAPMSSIEQCVAKIGEQADYRGAGRVRHEVDSKERRNSGHTIMIDTTVFDEDGTTVMREYATVCAVAANAETKAFKLRQKGI